MEISQKQTPFTKHQLEQLPFVHILEHFAEILNSKPKVYTIEEVAEILKCKERTVKHHLYEIKDLKYLKIGREVRIREEDLKAFLANQLTLCHRS